MEHICDIKRWKIYSIFLYHLKYINIEQNNHENSLSTQLKLAVPARTFCKTSGPIAPVGDTRFAALPFLVQRMG